MAEMSVLPDFDNHLHIWIAYQSRHGKISRMHLLSQPVDLSSRVQENNSLGDRKGLVEVTKCVQLPLLHNQKSSLALVGY